MLNTMKADADRVMLLVIDLQSKLIPHIAAGDAVVRAADKLVRGVRVFDVPVMATVQYVKGLGPIPEPVAGTLEAAGVSPMEKMTFSVCGDDAMRQRLTDIDRPQVLVVGIEAHVCVQQTVLDLLAMGYAVHVCADAVGSRQALDRDVALRRMQQAGAIVTTTESVLFELCHESGTPRFKKLLEIVK
jgi:nicotinamidase-related amidase